jgi:hypothetical protein
VSILGEPKRHLVGGVVLEHIEDEALLDRLPHRIHMEGRWQVAGAGGEFERFGLGSGGVGHIGDASLPGAGAHLGCQQRLDVHLPTIGQIGHLSGGEHLLELVGRGAGLGS